MRDDWRLHKNRSVHNGASQAAFNAIVLRVTQLSIQANGLMWTAGVTPYQIVMHYTVGTQNIGQINAPIMRLNPPNYDHWWLRIDGGGGITHNDVIEAWPNDQYVHIRRGEYSVNNNVRVYVTSLRLEHVQKITATVNHVITGNHPAVVAHGVWADDNSRQTCIICAKVFNTFHRRHHCRCCGRLVCGDCSPGTRQLVLPVNRPNSGPEAGPHRVCMYC